MEAFFFGPEARRLFGVYHPASPTQDRHVGVVMCYPMGQEHIRSHRAYLQIAFKLAEAGFHTLRFDLSGSGDSALDFEECGMAEWKEDLERALDELVSGTGVERLCTLGVRLGAALTVLAGADRQDVDSMILWNPVVSGTDYVDDIVKQHFDYYRGSFARPGVASGETESLGFKLSPALLSQLRGIDLLGVEGLSTGRALLVDSAVSESPDLSIELLAQHLRQAGSQVDCIQGDAFPVWRRHKDEEFGNAAVPAEVLRDLLAWLKERYR